MIEFKKTEINLMYFLSSMFDIDYENGEIVCHSIRNGITYEFIKSAIEYNNLFTGSQTYFKIIDEDIDNNTLTILSSYDTIYEECVIEQKDEITVKFLMES